MSDSKLGVPDVFVANKSYPDAKGVFYKGYKSLAEVRETCIVVLDTNALLVPYGISKNSLSHIESTYRPLSESGRLIVPGQVAREFARNRPLKIAEIFQALSRKRNLTTLHKGRYPLLEDAPSYDKLQELENKIDNLIGEYRTAIGDMLSHIQSWNWNDPVSKLYCDLFPSIVMDLPLNEEEVLNRLTYQKENKLPPGYKDASKNDQGVGDQLVWQVVVHVATERKEPVVLVSGDSKSDWFYRSENQPLFPRFELVDEIRRVSDGKTLHIVSFSDFLELFGAEAETVGEVRNEEIKVDLSSMSRYGRAAVTGHIAEVAVANWLREKYPELEVNREDRLGDFVWSEWGGASILVSIKYFEGTAHRGRIRHYLKNSFDRFDRAYERKDWQFDNILVFLVFKSASVADTVVQDLQSFLSQLNQQQPQVVVAELSNDEIVRVQDPFNVLPEFN